MRKRTRIAVVAAALALALVGPAATGATGGAGGEGSVLAWTVSPGWFQRWARALGIAVGRSDHLAARAVQQRLNSVIEPIVFAPNGESLIPTPRQRARLYQVACKAQFTFELLREKKIEEQMLSLSTEIPGAVGYTMSVAKLSRELAKAKDWGDRVEKAGNAAFCAAADANLKRFR